MFHEGVAARRNRPTPERDLFPLQYPISKFDMKNTFRRAALGDDVLSDGLGRQGGRLDRYHLQPAHRRALPHVLAISSDYSEALQTRMEQAIVLSDIIPSS